MPIFHMHKYGKKYLIAYASPGVPVIIGALWPNRFLWEVLYSPLNGEAPQELPYDKIVHQRDEKTGITLLLAAFNEPCRVTTKYRTEQFADTWAVIFDTPKKDAKQLQELARVRMRLHRLGLPPSRFWELLNNLNTTIIDAYYRARSAVEAHNSDALTWLHVYRERSDSRTHQGQIFTVAIEFAEYMLSKGNEAALVALRHAAHSKARKKSK